MAGRRILFVALVLATMAALLALMAYAVSPRGFRPAELAVVLLFAITLPWMAIGLWNAVIGFLLLRFARDPVAAVFPGAAAADTAVTASCALLACIRNEAPDRLVRNLTPMLDGLAQAGVAEKFHVYLLSDSSDPEIAAAEEASFATLAACWDGRIPISYRRRTTNVGFKAGNIRDFCERWGANHDFAVTLDADSVMPAAAVLRLLRLMQAHPKLGILQALVIGLPSQSGFARLFQFGMRLGMRSYTLGSAWWQGDCGPYWGHNAILRLAPFRTACMLPDGPGGAILSHDQIEAVLMRRAGYEVRVLPQEDLGFEENPPTLVEFIGRDLRWCQGNMQYWPFLALPGLRPVSRFQLALAILMFLGSPAWMALLLLGSVVAAAEPAAMLVRPGAGAAVLAAVLLMWLAPQTAAALDVLMRRDERKAFGGGLRFALGFAVAMGFWILLSSIMWLSHTRFLAGLPFGRKLGWIGQVRDHHAVPLSLAWRSFWRHTVVGVAVVLLLAATRPAALPCALLIAAGLALAVPIAVVTSRPWFGTLLARIGLCCLPEETDPPPLLMALGVETPAQARRRGERGHETSGERRHA